MMNANKHLKISQSACILFNIFIILWSSDSLIGRLKMRIPSSFQSILNIISIKIKLFKYLQINKILIYLTNMKKQL